VLAAGVAGAIAAGRGGDRSAHATVATTTAVLATRATQTPRSRPAHTPARRATAAAGLRIGTRAAEHGVRVLAVVGPRIFWIGRGRGDRLLVHLQGSGTRWAIRPGQRLTFTAAVARTRPGAAAAWGLGPEEGRSELLRQGVHLEVFGPRIKFLCVTRCS
jgi:hypothetical protein